MLYRRALSAAVANARGKAQTLAGAAKVRLGAVRSIIESSAGPVPLAEKAAADAATPIEPGTQRIEATVTVESRPPLGRRPAASRSDATYSSSASGPSSAVSTAREPTTTPSAIRPRLGA